MFEMYCFSPANLSDVGKRQDCESSSDEGFREGLIRSGSFAFPHRHLADVQRLGVPVLTVVVANLKSGLSVMLYNAV
jgi:hypothetical protein